MTVKVFKCEHCGSDDLSFDRSICPCGSMHYFCGGCGTQVDECEATGVSERRVDSPSAQGVDRAGWAGQDTADLAADESNPPRSETPAVCHSTLEPGETCACGYRKSHPKTEASPKSAVKSFRIPFTEEEDKQHFNDLMAKAALTVGLTSAEKYWFYKFCEWVGDVILSDPELWEGAYLRAEGPFEEEAA